MIPVEQKTRNGWPCLIWIHVSVMLLLATSGDALGQSDTTLVAPNIYQDSEAPAGMLTVVATNARSYQAIFHEDQLTNLVNHEISSLAYRLNGVLTSGFPLVETTWSRYDIEIGNSVSPQDATGVFDDNFVSDSVMVRSGAFTVDANAWPSDSPGPSPWGVELEFDQAFSYEGGHLAVLIRHSGSDNQDPSNRLVDSASASSAGSGVDFTAVSALGADVAGGSEVAFVPVIRFTGMPTAVPEPGSIVVLGFLGLGAVCRRTRLGMKSCAPLPM